MNAEIINVGSELLLGQIVNTNAAFLGQELAKLGVNVFFHTSVGDNENRLYDSIITAKKRANFLILTGGLGPTKDDLTKETVAKVVGKKLVYDKESLCRIEAFFANAKRPMTENNKKQALVIEGSTVFINEHGLAAGMAFVHEQITYMLLPGPPKELVPMMLTSGNEYIVGHRNRKEEIRSRVLRFFGIGESRLEQDLIDLIEQQTNPTIAPLANDGEVTLRLTVKHQDPICATKLLDNLEEQIQTRVGEFFYGYDNTSLFHELLKILLAQGKTISAAESLTGGMFSEQVASISGASNSFLGGIVSYATELKSKLLQVTTATLTKHGAVSSPCAIEMAEKVREICNSTIGISFTGVAGPSEQEGKKVGTVFIAIAKENENTTVYELNLGGTRQQIRERAAKFGCYYLLKELKRWS